MDPEDPKKQDPQTPYKRRGKLRFLRIPEGTIRQNLINTVRNGDFASLRAVLAPKTLGKRWDSYGFG